MRFFHILEAPRPELDDYVGATWGRLYWPGWFWVMLLAMLVPETYALFTNSRNTLSYWVWHELDVHTGLAATTWTAAHFLVLGIWLVIMGWLTGHFFWRLWT